VGTNAAAENRDYGTSRWQLYDEATPFAHPRGRGATNAGAMTAIGSPTPCNSTCLQPGKGTTASRSLGESVVLRSIELFVAMLFANMRTEFAP